MRVPVSSQPTGYQALDPAIPFAKAAGIGHVHTHQLRHTLATRAINRGMSLEAIAAMLSHKTLRMTLVYARASGSLSGAPRSVSMGDLLRADEGRWSDAGLLSVTQVEGPGRLARTVVGGRHRTRG